MAHSLDHRPFLSRLVDGRDSSADSLIFVALVAVLGLIALSTYDVIAQHHEFYPMNFGGGVAAILGGLGGAKMVRDRWSPSGEPPIPPDQRVDYYRRSRSPVDDPDAGYPR